MIYATNVLNIIKELYFVYAGINVKYNKLLLKALVLLLCLISALPAAGALSNTYQAVVFHLL